MNLALQHRIGAIAGWKLELAAVPSEPPAGLPLPRPDVKTFSSDRYRGSVDASLVSNLASGNYTIVVEDVSEVDFKALTDMTVGKLLEARLYMYWQDAVTPVGSDDGLVAVLRVTSLRRRAGSWRYEMIVEGREWVYDRLLQGGWAVNGHGPLEAAVALAKQMVRVRVPKPDGPAPAASAAGDTIVSTDSRLTGAEQLRLLEPHIEDEAAATEGNPRIRGGLGMFLIRDGVLIIGPDRVDASERETLEEKTGLLDLQRTGTIIDLGGSVNLDRDIPNDDKDQLRHDLFVATMRGRPDLKPGDIVDFKAPEKSAIGDADLGFALGPPAKFDTGDTVVAYVQEVNHRLSREQGFITVVRCAAAVQATEDRKDLVDRLWMSLPERTGALAAGSSESFLGNMFEKLRDAITAERWPDVAQVRGQYLDNADGIPAQREKLWRGLGPEDGLPFGAARLPFAKVRKSLAAAPYLTPFAYGNCGLVLPRYPSTRVLVVNRRGDPEDPVDIGALWDDSPPASQVGDWWLILPVDLEDVQEPLPDSKQGLAQPAERATNDLIDGRGNRVIEVGTLTIRIGHDQLTTGGIRPAAGNDPVTIEHGGGNARIVIAQDGSITIESAKTVTIKGNEGIAMETGGNVTMTVGGNVDVKKGT
jgi:hypothetical protein